MTKSNATAAKRAETQRAKAPHAAHSGAAAKPVKGKSITHAPLVGKQPQSKQQSAVSGGMFLHTNDVWSRAYFDKNDLHFAERELFG